MIEFIFSAAFGAFIVLGFYHLMGFCKRRQEKAFVFFGMMMILLSLYSFVNNPFIVNLSRQASGIVILNPANRFRLSVLLADILAPLCLSYLGSLFPEDFSFRIIKLALVSVFISVLVAVFLPYRLGISWEDNINEFLVNIIIAYILLGCTRAITRKREDARLFIIALMPGIATGVAINLMKNSPDEVEFVKPVILVTGTLTSVILQSIILADRNARTCIKIEESSRNLLETNQAFSRFVPHGLLSLMNKQDITSVCLGDHSQHEMTVMFVDIRGFTSFSENMTPEENFVFLNNLMKGIGPVIRNNHGLVDKYIGDGIMALFPGKPCDSLRAAVGIRSVLAEYNRVRTKKSLPDVTIGIGIHSGELMIGTIGESERMDCTVISDAVNTAARLERATKFYGCTIIVSESVVKSLENSEEYHFRMLGRMRPKGKKSPVGIMEVFTGDTSEMILSKLKTMPDFLAGIECYQKGSFKEANAKFAEVISSNDDDIVSINYYSRSLYYLVNGIPIDWDGIEEIDVK